MADKASIPRDDTVKLQFVSALDAWVQFEHALSKLFYVLLKPVSFGRAQSVFSAINGIQAQREAVAALADRAIPDRTMVERINGLLDRARRLSTKRNRLVHGRWRFLARDDGRELFRAYYPANLAALGPASPTKVFDLKGRYTFFLDDLKRCETEFEKLAEDIDAARLDAAFVLRVNPHIELSDEQVLELPTETSPLKDHPPETP